MPTLTKFLILAGCLLAIVALVQVTAARLATPASTLLSGVGIALGASYVGIEAVAPGLARFFFAPLVDPTFPAEAYLWLFLPPLLFQAALTVDVHNLLRDAAPVLMLAVVAVFVATGAIGIALAAVAPQSLVVCLLLGAIVATTDPSAVVAVFRDVGAPGRLIQLVEGESLLNDAAAIAAAGVLTSILMRGSTEMVWLGGLASLATSFGGGLLVGLLVGRAVATLLPRMNNMAAAETALTMAVPYPLYLLCSEYLDVSGVVAVVCAALVVNGLARTRMAQANWSHVQLVWEQIAMVAGAVVFLLAAVRVPHLLRGVTALELGYLFVTVIAALVARLAVLMLMLPALSALKLSAPISTAYRLAIAWGGLRGAVTLVLAMGVAENTALAPQTRQFVSVMATGFVLFSLLVNGTTLRWVIRRLGLDRLSAQDQSLQRQAIALSTVDVEATVRRTAAVFHIAGTTADTVNQAYRDAILPSASPIDAELPERDRLAIGLTTLATRERDLIPDYGNGIVSVANLDAMTRNADQMIDAVRSEGRVGYNRAARRIVDPHLGYRLALWAERHLHIETPLANAIADRFELLICRRAVLERLRAYNRSRIEPLLGERMAGMLETILVARSQFASDAIDELRRDFGTFTLALERRMLLLFALRQGRERLELMAAERVISKEVANWMRQDLDRAWQASVARPPLHANRLRAGATPAAGLAPDGAAGGSATAPAAAPAPISALAPRVADPTAPAGAAAGRPDPPARAAGGAAPG